MKAKKRCPHCTKVMEQIDTEDKPQWVCNNTKKHKYPVYVPPLANVDNEEGEGNGADS